MHVHLKTLGNSHISRHLNGFIILSITGFTSSRREVGEFYHFITVIFWLVLS